MRRGGVTFRVDERGQAMVEFAVSALAFALLTAALIVLGEFGGMKVRALTAARYAAWQGLTARDTGRVAQTFFENRSAKVAVTGGRSGTGLGLSGLRTTGSLKETLGTPLFVALMARGRALRAEAEVTAEDAPSALRLLEGSGGFHGPFQAKARAVVATDPWNGLRGVELGVAVTGQLDLLPVLSMFALF